MKWYRLCSGFGRKRRSNQTHWKNKQMWIESKACFPLNTGLQSILVLWTIIYGSFIGHSTIRSNRCLLRVKRLLFHICYIFSLIIWLIFNNLNELNKIKTTKPIDKTKSKANQKKQKIKNKNQAKVINGAMWPFS